MEREALGTYKGVFEHMGCWGIRVVSKLMGASKHKGGCPDCPKHKECQVNAPKCKTYMPLKKIRGV